MSQPNQEDYNFETLGEKQTSDFAVKRPIKKEKNKWKTLLIATLIVSTFLGIRWRYSVGGKLILINLLLNLIPYTIIFRKRSEKPSKLLKMFLASATLVSFGIASYGYLTQSTGKLTFSRESIELPSNSQYQLEIFSERYGSEIPKLNIKSSNTDVVSVPKWVQYLEIKEKGRSRVKVFDDYGNHVEIEIISELNIPREISRLGSSVIKKGDKSLITYLGNGNQQLQIEMTENPIVASSEYYYFGLQEGTAPYKVKHANYPTIQGEFTVISQDDYVFNLCDIARCEPFSVGDTIDIQSLIPDGAKNISVTSDSSIFSQNGIEITATKSGIGFITITYDDISFILQLRVRESNLQSVIVADFDGSVMTISQKRNLGIMLSPSNSKYKSLRYESSNPSIATVDEDGNVTPVQNGYTFIDVTIDDQKVTIPVYVEL